MHFRLLLLAVLRVYLGTTGGGLLSSSRGGGVGFRVLSGEENALDTEHNQ
jgi:hypothetical protein